MDHPPDKPNASKVMQRAPPTPRSACAASTTPRGCGGGTENSARQTEQRKARSAGPRRGGWASWAGRGGLPEGRRAVPGMHTRGRGDPPSEASRFCTCSCQRRRHFRWTCFWVPAVAVGESSWLAQARSANWAPAAKECGAALLDEPLAIAAPSKREGRAAAHPSSGRGTAAWPRPRPASKPCRRCAAARLRPSPDLRAEPRAWGAPRSPCRGWTENLRAPAVGELACPNVARFRHSWRVCKCSRAARGRRPWRAPLAC